MATIPITMTEPEFGLFQRLLLEKSGLYFSKDKIRGLEYCLGDRLKTLKFRSYQEYYDYLLGVGPDSESEMQTVFDLVTIGETFFYRTKPHFEVLTQSLLPELVRRKTLGRSIRIWSAGCSRGDEPYSIAIAVTEALAGYGDGWTVSILATDINGPALARAKEGKFSERSVAHVPPAFLEKYFRRSGDHYALDESVKKLVNFEYHNLAADPFDRDGMKDLDIIFCRNVMIYFDYQTMKRVIDNFHACLVDGGFLLIGPAETLWQLSEGFEAIFYPQTFVYKRIDYAAEKKTAEPFISIPSFDFGGSPALPAFEERARPEETPAPPMVEKKHEAAERGRQKPGSALVASLARATELANKEKYDEAREILEKILRDDNLYIDAHYLLGVLYYKLRDLAKAEEQFRKVIYIDHSVILAYFNLGNIYLNRRQYPKAAKEFANAVNLLKGMPRDEYVRFCEDVTVELLQKACENNLAKIKK